MALFAACTATGIWHAAKPLPAGLHLQSALVRITEADVEFLKNSPGKAETLSRQLSVIGTAEHLIVLDQSPLPREVAQALLLRKHTHAGLKALIVTDPGNAEFGTTQQQDLETLERAGVIVARVRAGTLRDSNLLYSPLWRLALSWWTDQPDGRDGNSWLGVARRLNFKADGRQILMADDGGGGWISVLGHADAQLALLLHAAPVRDMIRSELALAQWSGDDDRLPLAPPPLERRVGTIDTRFVTEGAVAQLLLDELGAAQAGDEISIAVRALSERRVLRGLKRAAAQHVSVRLLLDPLDLPNTAAADELAHAGIEVRWNSAAPRRTQYFLRHHAGGFDACIGTANFSRRDLSDFNLDNAVELHMPARSATALTLAQLFTAAWSRAAPYGMYARESPPHYWQYRLSEAFGSGSF